eukprot:m51a1_g3362 putative atp-dependent lon protease (297) ;mRNA; r:441985-442875
MADCSQLLQQGLDLVRQASTADTCGDYATAVRQYSAALECFLSVLRLETNQRITATLRPKVREYMDRAEQLKKLMAERTHSLSSLPSVPSSQPQDPVAAAPAAARVAVAMPVPPSAPPAPPAAPQQAAAAAAAGALRHARTITLRTGQRDCSYDSLYGELMRGAGAARVSDSCLSGAARQAECLAFLCEAMLRNSGSSSVSVEVMTVPASDDAALQQRALAELSASMRERGCSLTVKYGNDGRPPDGLFLSNGWQALCSRGIDVHSPAPLYSVGSHDLAMRPCIEATIEVFFQQPY